MSACFKPRLGLAAALLLVSSAYAQDDPARAYPSRPVKLIVAYAVGGGTDIMARLAAKELSTAFGQAVVVENRPGTLALAGTADTVLVECVPESAAERTPRTGSGIPGALLW